MSYWKQVVFYGLFQVVLFSVMFAAISLVWDHFRHESVYIIDSIHDLLIRMFETHRISQHY